MAGSRVKSALGPAVFDDEVSTLNPPQIAQTLAECVEGMRPHGRRVPEEADPRHLPRLLRLGHQRRGEEAQGDRTEELAAVHYWMTSSARASTDGGMVRPSVFAVFKLMTNSIFSARSTGNSDGLAPLRILST